MYDWIIAFPEEMQKCVIKEFFFVLDEQSVQDRSVTVIARGPIWVDAEGDIDKYGEVPDEEVTETVMWKRYRVPFEKVWDFWSILIIKPGSEGEEFLQNVVREDE